MRLEILPVTGIGEVTPGTDLTGLIAAAAPWLADGDVLVVTSKIVSKAEGRLVSLPPAGPRRDQARRETIAAETARAVAARGETRIVATHHGFVMAAAGVDGSNIDSSQLVLLPKDPDASARALRAGFATRHGRRVAVIVSDTMGRPWRNGLTDVALGAAGIAPLRDHRGETDQYGNQLHLTQQAVVDQLAGAAELVKGKTDGVPVAVVRGLPAVLTEDGPGVVAELVRPSAEDLFALGTAEARAAGLRAAAALPETPAHTSAGLDDLPATLAAARRALDTVAGSMAPGTQLRLETAPPPGIHCATPATAEAAAPAALLRLGADVHRLRAALAAEGLDSTVHQAGPRTVRVALAGWSHR